MILFKVGILVCCGIGAAEATDGQLGKSMLRLDEFQENINTRSTLLSSMKNGVTGQNIQLLISLDNYTNSHLISFFPYKYLLVVSAILQQM
jgi:hypothetical protein